MKKYQSGGKASRNFKSAQDSVQTARNISREIRKGPSEELERYLNRQGFAPYQASTNDNARFSLKDKQEIQKRGALKDYGMRKDISEPANKYNPKTGGFDKVVLPYKEGGTIKKQTMKNKTAPKKKMSAKEMEAMKKAKTPMMKYGGKMGKKPC